MKVTIEFENDCVDEKDNQLVRESTYDLISFTHRTDDCSEVANAVRVFLRHFDYLSSAVLTMALEDAFNDGEEFHERMVEKLEWIVSAYK